VRGLEFEWDEDKAIANLEKHDVSFAEATTVFADALSLTIEDPDHSLGEERCIILGMSIGQRLLVVAYTERRDIIRLISARVATRSERRNYEQ
jgi:uncharacterized protein